MFYAFNVRIIEMCIIIRNTRVTHLLSSTFLLVFFYKKKICKLLHTNVYYLPLITVNKLHEAFPIPCTVTSNQLHALTYFHFLLVMFYSKKNHFVKNILLKYFILTFLYFFTFLFSWQLTGFVLHLSLQHLHFFRHLPNYFSITFLFCS